MKKILRAIENLKHDYSILNLLPFHNSNTCLDALTTVKKLISTYSVLGYTEDYKNNLMSHRPPGNKMSKETSY